MAGHLYHNCNSEKCSKYSSHVFFFNQQFGNFAFSKIKEVEILFLHPETSVAKQIKEGRADLGSKIVPHLLWEIDRETAF